MASTKLFYNIKLCDATDCINNHLPKIDKIERHVKQCFDHHLVRDNLFNYVLPGQSTISEATHMQYLDMEGNIHIIPLSTKDPLTPLIINFRLLTLSRWYYLFAELKPYVVGIKPLLIAYNNHLIK